MYSSYSVFPKQTNANERWDKPLCISTLPSSLFVVYVLLFDCGMPIKAEAKQNLMNVKRKKKW